MQQEEQKGSHLKNKQITSAEIKARLKRGESTQVVSSQQIKQIHSQYLHPERTTKLDTSQVNLEEAILRILHCNGIFIEATEGPPPSKPGTNVRVRYTIVASPYFHSPNFHTTEQLQCLQHQKKKNTCHCNQHT